jgi:hypothetical protein
LPDLPILVAPLPEPARPPAKGTVGALAEKEIATPPPGALDLRDSHDGTRNQDIMKVE